MRNKMGHLEIGVLEFLALLGHSLGMAVKSFMAVYPDLYKLEY